MAVAAYASVLSLLRVLDNVQHPSHLRFFPDTTQIDALREKLCFLQDFLEVHHSSTIITDIEFFVRKIPRVTYDAEIFIDKYVVDHLYRELYPQNDVVPQYEPFHAEIQQVMHEIESINEALTTLMRSIRRDQEKPRVQLDKFTGNKPLKNKVVGFDDQLRQVLEKLTGNQPNLMIITIVGMGGIGKTTLARSLFDHPYNVHHFSVRIWLTISQDYSVEKVLQGLLNDGVLGDMKDRELGDESESELITKLHQKLFGQRYLIVLDDVWSLQAWYDLRRGFPDNRKGSRVMVTTRLSDIANSLDSPIYSFSMKFLDADKSWDLFSEKAFEKGGRSLELEKIGREISERCNGLPLLLVVIGGLLANSNMTVEHWQIVADDINWFASSANDEYCLRILSLSYNHLPIHLKPCFLDMRYFEEDSDIKVSELIKTWVSHGFVKPMAGKSLEEAAVKHLEDLVGRNMLLIRERSKRGKIKFCGIHDLLRDLSIKESNEEHLLELPKIISVDDFRKVRVICKEKKTDIKALHNEILGSGSGDKIMASSSCESTFPEFTRSKFVMAIELQSQNAQLPTTCRWIALHSLSLSDIFVFPTVRLIWNLEILEIRQFRTDTPLPKELWEMPQLRHVKVRGFGSRLPDPVSSTKSDVMVLENLQMLTKIKDLKFTEEHIRRMPNLRKLGVRYYYDEGDWSSFHLQNLALLQKLESFTINYRLAYMDMKRVIAFPCSLKKLTLKRGRIALGDLTIIGSLPNLKALKLLQCSGLGDWIPIEGAFLRLKHLYLRDLDLVHWRVDHENQFPALETLALDELEALKAIPREIGELPSLKSIYVQYCDENLVDSARAIVEEQLSYGNERLVVHVREWDGSTYQIGGANHV